MKCCRVGVPSQTAPKQKWEDDYMISKKIAVLGGGNGAHMMAADLSLRGHDVRMYEMPQFRGKLAQLFETKTILVEGIMNACVTLPVVTDDITQAIDGVHYILLVTPAFAHEGYANLLKGKVKKNQIIVVFPGAFAALILRKAFGEVDCPVIADANNLPYDTRLTAPCKLSLYGHNKINIGFLPAEKGPELIEEMREDLYPFEKLYSDVLECGLSIVNPALHSGPCLLNISRIEAPTENFFLYEHGFTPSAAKVDIALDNERKAIGKALGYNLRPIEDFSGLDEGYTWQQLYMATHGAISLTPISGPNDIFNRYLTEDAPYGLVPWSSLAKLLGITTPTIDSVVNIYNIIHETDWTKAGNTVDKLGLAGMSAEQITRYVKTGRK